MSQNRILTLFASFAFNAAVAAGDCPAPPVWTVADATCLAEAYVLRRSDSPWQMKYEALDLKDHWLVTYSPKDSNVRGGGGKLRVEKLSGRVVFVEGYR